MIFHSSLPEGDIVYYQCNSNMISNGNVHNIILLEYHLYYGLYWIILCIAIVHYHRVIILKSIVYTYSIPQYDGNTKDYTTDNSVYIQISSYIGNYCYVLGFFLTWLYHSLFRYVIYELVSVTTIGPAITIGNIGNVIVDK